MSNGLSKDDQALKRAKLVGAYQTYASSISLAASLTFNTPLQNVTILPFPGLPIPMNMYLDLLLHFCKPSRNRWDVLRNSSVWKTIAHSQPRSTRSNRWRS